MPSKTFTLNFYFLSGTLFEIVLSQKYCSNTYRDTGQKICPFCVDTRLSPLQR